MFVLLSLWEKLNTKGGHAGLLVCGRILAASSQNQSHVGRTKAACVTCFLATGDENGDDTDSRRIGLHPLRQTPWGSVGSRLCDCQAPTGWSQQGSAGEKLQGAQKFAVVLIGERCWKFYKMAQYTEPTSDLCIVLELSLTFVVWGLELRLLSHPLIQAKLLYHSCHALISLLLGIHGCRWYWWLARSFYLLYSSACLFFFIMDSSLWPSSGGQG